MSVEAIGDTRSADAVARHYISIDGTGGVGDLMTLCLDQDLEFETRVAEDGLWQFKLRDDALQSLPRICSAAIRATDRMGDVAEERIWVDLISGEIFDHQPEVPDVHAPDTCITLTDALALQPSASSDPLSAFHVRSLDLSLIDYSEVSLDAADCEGLSDVAALVFHGDEGHTIYTQALTPTGKRETIGDRDYDIYTAEHFDVLVDSEIRIVR